jgi:hypothetical protein
MFDAEALVSVLNLNLHTQSVQVLICRTLQSPLPNHTLHAGVVSATEYTLHIGVGEIGMYLPSHRSVLETLLVMVDRVKGGERAPPSQAGLI